MELTEVDLGDNREAAEVETGRCVRSRVSSNADSLVEDEEAELGRSRRASRASFLVSDLLTELYSVARLRHRDSVDSSTEASAGSDAFPGGRGSSAESRVLQELQRNSGQRHQRKYLAQKDISELTTVIWELNYRICVQSAKLLRLLKQKDRLLHKVQRNCDIVTACLQAVSPKRQWEDDQPFVDLTIPTEHQGAQHNMSPQLSTSYTTRMLLGGVDTKLKFTLEPSLGQNGFQQWHDALKAVARLSTGIPKEWRRKVWLTLADHYLKSIAIDWDKTMRFTFNDQSNPDDDSMGIQIVKDLHRTGCSSYCGQEAEQDRVVLKRVLLAYARWNKSVGYCQGFNILAALILEVVEGNEGDALKIMIYLIDKVLPDSYFVNNLKALSVDMAVFRDLLRMKLPKLSQHLDTLQRAANKESGGGYEPPLTNVFTMQWFLTLFATCLPNHTVLKIWDSVFFEGSEIILRAALAIWAKLEEQINSCETADDFYGTMGKLTQEMLEDKLVDSNELMQMVYSMAQFPFPQLSELREKYTYNITPFPATVKSTASRLGKIKDSDEENEIGDEDSIANVIGCLGSFSGFLAPELQNYQKHFKDYNQEESSGLSNIAELSPGAINACRNEYHAAFNSMMMERMTTDINALKRQYSRIKRKQQQQVHHVYITAGYEDDDLGIVLDPRDQLNNDKGPVTNLMPSQVNHSSVINHLLLGKKIKQTSKSAKNNVPSHTGGKMLPGPHEDIKAKLNSPWHTHMRVHRKNIERAKGHLGYGDTIGLIEKHSERGKASSINTKEETANKSKTVEGDGNLSTDGQSPKPTYKNINSNANVSVVQQKLETLELTQNSRDGTEDKTHSYELPSLANDSGIVTKSCMPRPQVFCPFPSVKPLRKSAAARNLGLYGPNERTPTVHFPQMSRSFNKPTSGNSGSKKTMICKTTGTLL